MEYQIKIVKGYHPHLPCHTNHHTREPVKMIVAIAMEYHSKSKDIDEECGAG
jgi:hypothetical protein